MTKSLIPRSVWGFPFAWDEEEQQWPLDVSHNTGLSVWEDDNHVHIEAAVPGLKPEEIEVTFEKGVLWIKAEKKQVEEDKKKKFYRKAVSTYSYRVAVPGQIDASTDPEASYKDGIMKVTFQKTKQSQPKKIAIKH